MRSRTMFVRCVQEHLGVWVLSLKIGISCVQFEKQSIKIVKHIKAISSKSSYREWLKILSEILKKK